MEDHKCPFAEAIGQSPEWQTDDKGKTVCKYCQAPKEGAPAKAVAKTVRK